MESMYHTQQWQPGPFSFQPADTRYMHHLLSPAATALFWQHVQPVEFMKEIPAVTLVKKNSLNSARVFGNL